MGFYRPRCGRMGMKLLKLLTETFSPSNKLMRKSYDDLVSSRKSLTQSILLSRREYDERQRKLSKEIEGRVKNKEGDLPNPMDTLNNRTSYTLSNQKNIEVLRRIQELETDVMSLLNNRGIGVFDEEDFEEEEILIPR